MKKIAFCLPDFRGGGAENVIITLSNELSKIYNVYLLVGKQQGILQDRINENITCISLGTTSGLLASRKIAKICNMESISTVIGTLGMAHSVSLSKLFGNKATCIARVGNTISEDLKRWSGVNKILRTVYQRVLCLSQKVIAQSEYMKKDIINLINIDEDKVIVIYNPIDLHRLNSLKKLPISTVVKQSDIVYVGRLEQQKDVATTLLAFKLYSNDSDATLHIIGDGYERHELENLASELGIKNKVLFHGFLKNPYPILDSCNIFVMSSLYEGFSNSLLEAVALNKKIVVSNSPGGNSEIIKNGVNGYLFETRNHTDMYEKMKMAEKLNIDKNNVEPFTLENIKNKYISLIK